MPHDQNYMAVATMAQQLQQQVAQLTREVDEAREWARRLFAHNQEMARDMLDMYPHREERYMPDTAALIAERDMIRRQRDARRRLCRLAREQRDTARTQAHRWHAEYMREHATANQLDAGNASLRYENAQLRERLAELERRPTTAVVCGDCEAREVACKACADG